jgi:hypothetical protein
LWSGARSEGIIEGRRHSLPDIRILLREVVSSSPKQGSHNGILAVFTSFKDLYSKGTHLLELLQGVGGNEAVPTPQLVIQSNDVCEASGRFCRACSGTQYGDNGHQVLRREETSPIDKLAFEITMELAGFEFTGKFSPAKLAVKLQGLLTTLRVAAEELETRYETERAALIAGKNLRFICPGCDGPADRRFEDLVCVRCWPTKGTLGQLLKRNSSNSERGHLAKMDSWVEFQHWSRELIKKEFIEPKTSVALENWLIAENQISREALRNEPVSRIVDLLRTAVGNARTKEEVNPQKALIGTLDGRHGEIESPRKKRKLRKAPKKGKVDPRNYRYATDIQRNYNRGLLLTYKQLKSFLAANLQIQTHSPRKNRLLVHKADWDKNFPIFEQWHKTLKKSSGKKSSDGGSTNDDEAGDDETPEGDPSPKEIERRAREARKNRICGGENRDE